MKDLDTDFAIPGRVERDPLTEAWIPNAKESCGYCGALGSLRLVPAAPEGQTGFEQHECVNIKDLDDCDECGHRHACETCHQCCSDNTKDGRDRPCMCRDLSEHEEFCVYGACHAA